jgi:hypothetical protein
MTSSVNRVPSSWPEATSLRDESCVKVGELPETFCLGNTRYVKKLKPAFVEKRDHGRKSWLSPKPSHDGHFDNQEIGAAQGFSGSLEHLPLGPFNIQLENIRRFIVVHPI